MDLITYINSYKNCAINGVPKDTFDEWVKQYHDIAFNPFYGSRSSINVRFHNGRYASRMSQEYHVGDRYGGGRIEQVIQYAELSQYAYQDDDFDMSCLL